MTINNKSYQKLLALVYPPSCVLCGQVLTPMESDVCRECRPQINYIHSPTCMRCGGEITDEEREFCDDCERTTRSYVRGFPAMRYEYPLDESLAQFKYHNKRGYGDYYAKEILARYGTVMRELYLDALIPVPIHKDKYRERGYNQAELLANKLGEALEVPVDAELLIRTRYTPPQKKLSRDEREINMKRAFQSSGKCVQYKRVMLVDDIYTTGATVEACTRLLHEMGIGQVYYTSVCIGTGTR